METARKEKLIANGINVDSALSRMMGSEKMLEKYLGRFLEEKSYAALLDAVSANDEKAAQAAAHTLKSVCGTLGCEKMQNMVIEQEKEMRAGNWQAAVDMMPQITEEYNRICDVLKS